MHKYFNVQKKKLIEERLLLLEEKFIKNEERTATIVSFLEKNEARFVRNEERIMDLENVRKENQIISKKMNDFMVSIEGFKSFGIRVLGIACASIVLGILKFIWEALKFGGLF